MSPRLSAIVVALFVSVAHAFVVDRTVGPTAINSQLMAHLPGQKPSLFAVAASAVITSSTVFAPLVALAEDDYEYGAVNAPISIPIVAGILAILTALLPLALRKWRNHPNTFSLNYSVLHLIGFTFLNPSSLQLKLTCRRWRRSVRADSGT